MDEYENMKKNPEDSAETNGNSRPADTPSDNREPDSHHASNYGWYDSPNSQPNPSSDGWQQGSQPPYRQNGYNYGQNNQPYGQNNYGPNNYEPNNYGPNNYGPNGYGPNNQNYWQPEQQPPKKNNGLAIASMIIGIFALLSCCIPLIQFPLAVAAIVLAILSKKKKPFSGFAIAGLIMGIIAIVISILMTFYWGYVFTVMNDPELLEMYSDLLNSYQ